MRFQTLRKPFLHHRLTQSINSCFLLDLRAKVHLFHIYRILRNSHTAHVLHCRLPGEKVLYLLRLSCTFLSFRVRQVLDLFLAQFSKGLEVYSVIDLLRNSHIGHRVHRILLLEFLSRYEASRGIVS